MLGMLQHSHVAEVRALAASTGQCAGRDNWDLSNALQAEQLTQVPPLPHRQQSWKPPSWGLLIIYP